MCFGYRLFIYFEHHYPSTNSAPSTFKTLNLAFRVPSEMPTVIPRAPPLPRTAPAPGPRGRPRANTADRHRYHDISPETGRPDRGRSVAERSRTYPVRTGSPRTYSVDRYGHGNRRRATSKNRYGDYADRHGGRQGDRYEDGRDERHRDQYEDGWDRRHRDRYDGGRDERHRDRYEDWRDERQRDRYEDGRDDRQRDRHGSRRHERGRSGYESDSSSSSDAYPRRSRHDRRDYYSDDEGDREERSRRRLQARRSYRSATRAPSLSQCDRRERRLRSPSPSVWRKWSGPLDSAIDAGAMAAIRMRRQPGKWVGPKGARIFTAALGAAALDAFI